jgi:O-antigen/teichoic acid export membrane protein
VAINLLAYPVLWIMTTPDYYSASEFIPWFTLGWLLYGIYGFVRPILIKYNQQKFIGMNSLFTMVVMIVANIAAAHYLGYKGISYAFCIVYLLLTIPLILRAQKVHPLPWVKAMKIW